jgi:hypothetical protein
MDKNEKIEFIPEAENVRKSSSGTTIGGVSERNLYIDRKEELKLLFKLDIHIAPIVMVLYLIAFLDRYNRQSDY